MEHSRPRSTLVQLAPGGFGPKSGSSRSQHIAGHFVGSCDDQHRLSLAFSKTVVCLHVGLHVHMSTSFHSKGQKKEQEQMQIMPWLLQAHGLQAVLFCKSWHACHHTHHCKLNLYCSEKMMLSASNGCLIVISSEPFFPAQWICAHGAMLRAPDQEVTQHQLSLRKHLLVACLTSLHFVAPKTPHTFPVMYTLCEQEAAACCIPHEQRLP